MGKHTRLRQLRKRLAPKGTIVAALLTPGEMQQLQAILQGSVHLEDFLAANGFVLQSGTVAAMRQQLRVLGGRLAPAPVEDPKEKAEEPAAK